MWQTPFDGPSGSASGERECDVPFNERLAATMYKSDYASLEYPFQGYDAEDVKELDISVQTGNGAPPGAVTTLIVFACLSAFVSILSWAILMYLQCKR